MAEEGGWIKFTTKFSVQMPNKVPWATLLSQEAKESSVFATVADQMVVFLQNKLHVSTTIKDFHVVSLSLALPQPRL